MEAYKEFKIKKGMEIKGLYTVFKQKFDSKYFFEGEIHDFWELVCVLKGKVGITAGKYVYSLKEGECFIHRPMEFHRIWAEGGTEPEIAIFTFSGKNTLKTDFGVHFLSGDSMEKVKSLIKKSDMIFCKKNGVVINGIKENAEYEMMRFVNELENLILNIIGSEYSRKGAVPSSSAEKYTSAIKIMESNIDKRLSAEALADLCNISLPNLKKIFKKYSGGGVMEYFGNMKIKAAKQLLKEGKSVKETAYMLGFYDQNYFNVFFKRYVGISPGKYRGI